mmetsp:Transcript_28266/g.46470  ORF Transcript_28266/g.46470 Transcript_28266/m.46470 type:complete len:237 (+) Transcript_28266:61-771(+)
MMRHLQQFMIVKKHFKFARITVANVLLFVVRECVWLLLAQNIQNEQTQRPHIFRDCKDIIDAINSNLRCSPTTRTFIALSIASSTVGDSAHETIVDEIPSTFHDSIVVFFMLHFFVAFIVHYIVRIEIVMDKSALMNSVQFIHNIEHNIFTFQLRNLSIFAMHFNVFSQCEPQWLTRDDHLPATFIIVQLVVHQQTSVLHQHELGPCHLHRVLMSRHIVLFGDNMVAMLLFATIAI